MFKRLIMLILFSIVVATLCGAVSATDTSNLNDVNNTNIPDPIINGTVTHCGGTEPFEGVTVTVYTMEDQELATTQTNNIGNYNIAFLSTDTTFKVTASYPNHYSSSQQVTVSPNVMDPTDPNMYGTANFQLGTDAYVDGENGLDTNDGLTPETAKQTISAGIGIALDGWTVHVADWTYSGANNRNITIAKNIDIIGESRNGTILNGSNTARIFIVKAGFTVEISNLTFTNGFAGNSGSGGAIHNSGTLIVNNCSFNNNSAAATGSGGAIFNNSDSTTRGDLTINNCSFTSNQGTYCGALCNIGDLTVNDSTFTNNYRGAIFNGNGDYGTAYTSNLTINNCTFTDNNREGITGGGGAIVNWGVGPSVVNINDSIFINNSSGSGGAIANNRSTAILNVNRCTFNSNHATSGDGGAIDNYNGTATVLNSSFIANTATNNGGAIFNYDWSTTNIHFCRIVDNTATTGDAIYNYYGTTSRVNAENNWWGQNDDPKDVDNLIEGNINYIWGFLGRDFVYADPWIYMTVTADPTSIDDYGTSRITVSLNNNYDGSIVTELDPEDGHIPNHASSVTYNADQGSIDSPMDLTEGTATSYYNADGSTGTSTILTQYDDQLLNTFVDIYSNYLYVTDTDPVDGATDVDQSKQIVVTFNKDVQAGSNYGGITVRTQATHQGYSITKNIVDNQLFITGKWTPGITFEIVLPKNSIQDLTGNQIATTYTSTFTASSGPSVTNFNPTDGATDVAQNQQIIITFSDDIQAGGNYHAITVRNAATGQGYTLNKSIAGNTLTITGKWTPGVTFEIVIPKNSIADTNGNANANIYTSTFTVAAS